MLDVNDNNTIRLDDVAWPNVTCIAIDRIAWDLLTDRHEDGASADDLRRLDSGHHFVTMVVYRDGRWHSVGWSVCKYEILAFAAALVGDRRIPLGMNPSMVRYLRNLD